MLNQQNLCRRGCNEESAPIASDINVSDFAERRFDSPKTLAQRKCGSSHTASVHRGYCLSPIILTASSTTALER
jgi:hypothetical protein